MPSPLRRCCSCTARQELPRREPHLSVRVQSATHGGRSGLQTLLGDAGPVASAVLGVVKHRIGARDDVVERLRGIAVRLGVQAANVTIEWTQATRRPGGYCCDSTKREECTKRE